MRKLAISIFAFLALSAVVGFIATSGLSGAFDAADSAGSAGGASASRAPAVGAIPGDVVGVSEAVGGGAAAAGGATGPVADIGALPAIAPAIVKTARLELRVAKGEFDQAFRTTMDVAKRYAGYVQSSSTSGTRVRSGSLTIRVPSSAFENAMDDLSGVGTVESRSISGQDVTNEYVDLNARLRTWQAQEAVLLRLMKRATSVESTLRVQSNLQDVQFRIEQIEGQLRVLSDQTELATIDVALHEPGAAIPLLQRPGPPNERPSLAEAWTKAVDGFLGVLYATVVGLGYLVPIVAICAAVWFGFKRLRPATSSS